MAGSNRLLIVDDDPDIGALIVQVAESLGFQTLLVDRADGLVGIYRSFGPDIIVLDLMMPAFDGVQGLLSLASEGCEADIILFSGADWRVLNAVARLGEFHGLRIRELLHKPIDVDDLEAELAQFAHTPWTDPEAMLRADISRRDISVHFQPKVSLTSGEDWSVTGVEALARWPHPSRGMVSPGEFIPLAEKTGFLRSISCDPAQGYLFSKPLDKTDLTRFLEGDTVSPAAAIAAVQSGW